MDLGNIVDYPTPRGLSSDKAKLVVVQEADSTTPTKKRRNNKKKSAKKITFVSTSGTSPKSSDNGTASEGDVEMNDLLGEYLPSSTVTGVRGGGVEGSAGGENETEVHVYTYYF